MRYQINPIPQKLAPRFREVSPLRSPRDSDATPRIHYKTADNTKQISQLVQCVQQLQREINRLRRRGTTTSNAKDGWPPTEIDPTTVTPKGSYKFVSPQSFLAGTGYVQLTPGPNLGVTATAMPGRWRAVQDVPAAVTGSYNVPQPPPILGVPTGTPLKGDAEGDNVFWMPDGFFYDYCA